MYVAIDANIELSEEDGVMDVFGYVKKMRTQRTSPTGCCEI